ncbi:hypothetical protein CRM22_008401 [Opisthorchis felineus]|uniref:Uncharacterized protein n=1 Tax=Opisthorchis felineus TaxID=147828 RepID=A0A4S2LBT5_OPIFE|nr:hypothetical protein CRM22_008401 [Opisthorchis felineus]
MHFLTLSLLLVFGVLLQTYTEAVETEKHSSTTPHAKLLHGWHGGGYGRGFGRGHWRGYRRGYRW